MTFSLSKRSTDNLRFVNPRLLAVVKLALARSTVDFGVVNAVVRTASEQNALYHQGRSMPGRKVTDKDGYRNKSNHQVTADGTGHSVDLTAWVGGAWEFDDWNAYYEIAWAMAQAAQELGIRVKWGGNWYEVLNDYAHNLADVKEAVERYKKAHPGSDFIDGPHFELVS